jgi:hypothetical protein
MVKPYPFMQFFCENQSPVLRQHVKDAVSCLKLIDKTNFSALFAI